MAQIQRRWVLGGGIGSGKSEVRRLLAQRGIRAVDADSVGHSVLEGDALGPVTKRWPQVVVDGVIDRGRLAEIVFRSPEELIALELITHPLIFGRIETDLEGFDGIAVVEVPVMRRPSGWALMVVDAPDEVRIGRAVGRGMDRGDVLARMATQPQRGQWLAEADLVIPNHGSRDQLENAVSRLVTAFDWG